MAWSDTTRKGENSSSSGTTTQITLNSTAAGSLIAVGASAWADGSNPTTSVSDSVNGSYGSAIFTVAQGDQRCSLHVFPNNAGGSLTITVTASVAGFRGCFAHEFAGGKTVSPLSGTPGTDNGTSHPPTVSTTPAAADCLLIAVLGLNNTGTITENGSSEGFTLSNEFTDPPDTAQPGSMVFKILTGGSGASQSHSWTLGDTTPQGWAGGIAAFEPATARKFILRRPA